MISGIEIDEKLCSTFGLTDFTTLSENRSKIRYELGYDNKGTERFKKAYDLANKILFENFDGKSLWIRLVLWDVIEKSVLLNPLLIPLEKKLKFSRIDDGSLIFYFFIDKFDLNLIKGLVKSSVGYEIGVDDTLNITCFYFDFDSEVILNIYDDRGLDIIRKK